MTHGTRVAYQTGCRCLPCRLANAEYMASYRQRLRAGAVLLGAKVASAAARRLLDQLRREGIPKAHIAQALGLRSPVVRVHAQITVRKFMKIKRVHRSYLSEANE